MEPLRVGPAVAVPPGPRRATASRPVPERSQDLAHLGLDDLRAYRTALTHEESQVSYWRRILQARLDLVRTGSVIDRDHLRPVLTDSRVLSGRRALVELVPVDDIPPLPRLGELWDRRVEDDDPAGQAALEQDLYGAEAQLSEYRNALHRRIGLATGELIARYREQPALCLSALPLRPTRRAVPA